FEYVDADVVASPFSASVGPTEEFQTNGTALGFAEAKPGETFVKIGVGVLRRAGASSYDKAKFYELVDPGQWTVKKDAESVEFQHGLSDPATQYAYVYRKTVRLVPGKPQMVIDHALKNTGVRTIQSQVYNHNFLVLDKQAPGPDFVVSVPFEL